MEDEMIGKRFHKLIVIGFSSMKNNRKHYLCECNCGNKVEVMGKNLRTGNSKTCGCRRKTYIKKPNAVNTGKYKHIITKCGASIKVDENIFDYLNQFKWRIYKAYAVRSGIKSVDEKRNVYLHHEIIPVPENMWIDHINGDTLNNTIENLRVCTPQESVKNKCVSKNKKSKIPYKGVFPYFRNKDKFIAQIDGTHIGIFETAEDAAKAYNVEAVKRHKQFARLNNVK